MKSYQKRIQAKSAVVVSLVLFTVMVTGCAPRYGCYFSNVETQTQSSCANTSEFSLSETK